MPGHLSTAIFAAVTFSSLASALVPADPTITAPAVLPRQNNDQFIGWVLTNSSWYSQTCNEGLTWFQSGNYAQCCPTSVASCYAATACISGSLIYTYPDVSSKRTVACTANYNDTKASVCNTAFIYENTADSAPKTDIVCGDEAVNWSYYRQPPPAATQAKSRTAGSSGSSSSGSGDGGSKAWIAGAVIGPIVGLALIGAAVFFLLRRRKNKASRGAAISQVDPSQPPAGVGGYTDAKPQFPQQYNPDPYANQGAFQSQQQGYPQQPHSPNPQYNGAPAQSPQQEYYANDPKQGHVQSPITATELNGDNTRSHNPAELGGEARAPASPASPHVASELPGSANR